jgi:lysine 2,3-aminomutase
MNHLPRPRTLRRGEDFAEAGLTPADQIDAIDKVAERYAVAMTPLLAELAEPDGPIARQFVPDPRELATDAQELADPIGDRVHSPLPGIVHRYPDRLLLTPLLHCPVYCRFCFRRERVGGAEKALSDAELAAALDYIRAHDEVWEVILTGGDPLMLPPARLSALLAALEAIPHVAVIRIHSRIPIADPERIDAAMTAALTLARATLWLAVHCNHADEFSPAAVAACRRLGAAGIPLVGQTVLLKGVNDSAEALETLFRAMVQNRIKPYYLHHPDLAPGTGHFRTSIAQGQTLMRGLRGRVSGLCQPTYVLDIPGGHGKAPLGPVYWDAGTVTDWQGAQHNYADCVSRD